MNFRVVPPPKLDDPLYICAMITTQYFPQLISLTNIGSDTPHTHNTDFTDYMTIRVYFKPSEFSWFGGDLLNFIEVIEVV